MTMIRLCLIWAYADLDGLFRDELAAFDETQDPIEYANAWKDEIHRRLLQMGWEYLDQSSVPVWFQARITRGSLASCRATAMLLRLTILTFLKK